MFKKSLPAFIALFLGILYLLTRAKNLDWSSAMLAFYALNLAFCAASATWLWQITFSPQPTRRDRIVMICVSSLMTFITILLWVAG